MTQPNTDTWADGAAGNTPITAAKLTALRDTANAGLNGQLIPALPAKTGAYTAQYRDQVFVDASSGSVVITAPAAASGQFFGVVRLDTVLTNTVTVQRAGTDTFRGGGTTMTVGVGQGVVFSGVTGSPSLWSPKLEALDGHVHTAPSISGVAVRYVASTAQTIPTGADTPIALGTAVRTSSDVTQAARGVGHQFTLNRAGRWALGAGLRINTTSTGEAYLALNDNTNTAMIAQGGAIANNNPTRSVCLTDYFPAGQVLYVNGYQSSGTSYPASAASGWTYFTAVYLGA